MIKVTVGIIGAGRIGQLHADNLLQSDKFNLKTVADVYTDHLKGTHYENNIAKITNDTGDIFSDEEIDAIFICSSTDTHVDYIKKAAKSGKHIFCEKPISFDKEETREALDTVKQYGVKLQIGFNRRFDKHFRYVRDIVLEGKIGEPHLVKVTSRDPASPPEEYVKRSGGMFMDMTIHDFDMVRYLVGSEVVDVTVKAANLVDPMFGRHNDVDTAIITLTFENGAIAVIDNSRQAVYGYDQRIEVFGSLGSVEADNEVEVNVKVSTKENVTLTNPKAFFLERYKEAYVAEINDFAASILEDRELACSGEDGYKAEMLAEAANKSWKEGRTVKLVELGKRLKV
jgi:myo-inositol 2-dehydrogenase/D-chiro-inositol 1-dehydrogenase